MQNFIIINDGDVTKVIIDAAFDITGGMIATSFYPSTNEISAFDATGGGLNTSLSPSSTETSAFDLNNI